MYFGSGRFDCYMTSQTENAATASLYGTSNVLSPAYRYLPSALQCVRPSIELIKAYKQLFCLNSLNKFASTLWESNLQQFPSEQSRFDPKIMVYEQNHSFPVIIKQCSVAFCSIIAKLNQRISQVDYKYIPVSRRRK